MERAHGRETKDKGEGGIATERSVVDAVDEYSACDAFAAVLSRRDCLFVAVFHPQQFVWPEDIARSVGLFFARRLLCRDDANRCVVARFDDDECTAQRGGEVGGSGICASGGGEDPDGGVV